MKAKKSKEETSQELKIQKHFKEVFDCATKINEFMRSHYSVGVYTKAIDLLNTMWKPFA